MKFKNLFITAGLALAMGVGIGATLLAKQASKEAEAAVISTAKTYRFTVPDNNESPSDSHKDYGHWDKVYLHAWGSETPANNTTWGSFIELTEYSYNESDQRVFLFNTDVTDYKNFIIIRYNDNPDYCKSADITIGSNTAWYWNGAGGDPGSWTPENQTYYFYDYQNAYGGDIKVWAWMSNGTYNNAEAYASSPAMTRVEHSSYVYSISLDPMFDQVKFHNSDDSVADDNVWINKNRGKSFLKWESSTNWGDYEYALAHDWVNNTMHMRDISTEVTTDTGKCYGTDGSDGYYAKAYNDYNSFDNVVRTKIAQEVNYDAAYARFQAWGERCGYNVTISESEGTYSISQVAAARMVLPSAVSNSNGIEVFVIVLIASFAIVGICTYFFVRKRRQN